MFRKQDFKKVDLLGSGKKNTKIYKAEHIPTGKYYALKEVEAKTLEKLNEYKVSVHFLFLTHLLQEEAVQLFKVQNHPNVLQFYGYYFYETMYNTFRIAMVTEYMDARSNLEYLFRKRKQQGLFWGQEELEKMIVSVISTLSYLQSVGMAHRDLKPANKFVMENGEIKLIDFGESKDYFKDQDDGGAGTMATIRGTPQYLSPTLWKAHVEDGGNTRHVVHNLFKSDVYSAGLIFFQLASMEDVTGFNQKNGTNDGERLVETGLKKLRQRYSDHIIEIIRLMLKYEESERPSFVELAKLVLTSTENTIESPKNNIGKDGKK
jgi:serine/threonine protein kinase